MYATTLQLSSRRIIKASLFQINNHNYENYISFTVPIYLIIIKNSVYFIYGEYFL